MELILHCFGAATPSGEALHQLSELDIVGYSRQPLNHFSWLHKAELNDPAGFKQSGSPQTPAIWISFAPIWLLASFLEHLASHYPERLNNLNGVIACSSSSVITKRFASNSYDRHLTARLASAEDQIIATCHGLSVPCCILQPTLIYGQVGVYEDRNISRLLKQLRRFPLLPLPSECGLRQPIHARQLAAVALHFARQLITAERAYSLPERVALGGDTILTYAEMIQAVQQAQPSGDPALRCRLLSIPNRLFFLLAAPLLLRSPKSFEAVLRIGSNLSGFIPAHQLLDSEPQPFPVLPQA